MKHDKFKHLRSKVMFTIVGGAVIINPLYAQTSPAPAPKPDATTLQTVTVSGVRNSLEQSMNIKRYAIGGVDAVSAEDIGKMPDTNLAESLQRITGVSIDRRNGEGSQVTVRGFGPEFNLITIDGRTVPGADAFGAAGQVPIGGVNGGTRSFNFAQLSPNGVSSLEVYKTGRADVASGGIGATIDIKTDRPFYHEGGKVIASFGAKGTLDKSEPFDTSITPEYSGNFSYANPDKTWGIGIDASFAKRHGGAVEATENNWAIQPWTGFANGFNSDPAKGPVTNITNAPAIGQLYGMPNDVRYAVNDFQSKRTNAHAVLQIAPVDGLTMTLDYLYSRYDLTSERGEQSMWLQQQQFSDVTFNTDGPVATPTYIRDLVQTKDFGMEQQYNAQKYKLDDIGFNTVWQANDSLKLTLDLHDAKSQSLPNDGHTGGGATAVGLAGTNNCAAGPQCGGSWAQEFNFDNNTLPIATRTWYPNTNFTGTGLVNQPFGVNNLGIQPVRVDAQSQTTEVKEAKFGGELEFENGRFQFGADISKTKLHRTQAAQNYQAMGDWSVNDAGAYPDLADSLVHQVNTVGLFHGFNTDGIAQSTWIGNADDLADFAVSQYPGTNAKVMTTLAADNTVIENTKAVYAQLVLEGQLGDLPTTTRFGMRYEQTDVRSNTQLALPNGIVWLSNNDFQNPSSATVQPVTGSGSYSNLLPNVDFSIDLTDSLQGRASYSKTLARSPYGNLYAGSTVGNPSGSILVNPSSQATGASNNPSLKPLESDNLDLGLGWYFAKSSYLSVTFWDKRVSNFIGTSVSDQSLYGQRDPTSGPRALQAQAFLGSAQCAAQAGAPCAINDTTLFDAVSLIDLQGSTDKWNGGLADFNGTDAQNLDLESSHDVTANADDPLYQYKVSTQANVHSAMLHGWELGGQYFLGDTGFGILANYTKVDGDVHYKNGGSPSVDQFALTGLSDSANAVLMYEKYNFSVRLAFNWRASFLTSASATNPVYVAQYHQTDLSVNYDLNDHVSFQFEGINLTGEDVRWYGRTGQQFVRVVGQDPRYALGVRYKF